MFSAVLLAQETWPYLFYLTRRAAIHPSLSHVVLQACVKFSPVS